MKTFRSDLSNKEFPFSERVSAKTIRHTILKLILSRIAALQAPVIMMSQNRQEEKDRERSKKDYMINLKSELEIRILHEKIDHFIMDQQHELLETQMAQIDMLDDLLKRLEKNK